MATSTPVPTGWVWVSCARDVNPEFARERHLAKANELHGNWVTTACKATGAGEGTFRRDNRKPKCERCDLFAEGFAAAQKEK